MDIYSMIVNKFTGIWSNANYDMWHALYDIKDDLRLSDDDCASMMEKINSAFDEVVDALKRKMRD